MRREPMPLSCRLTVGSFTQTERARRVLSAVGLTSEVVRTEFENRRGCSYAIAYDCMQASQVADALRKAGIRTR